MKPTKVLETYVEQEATDEMKLWGALGFAALVASVVGDYGRRLYVVKVWEL